MMTQIGSCIVVELGPHSGYRAWCLQCEKKTDPSITRDIEVAEWVAGHSIEHYRWEVENLTDIGSKIPKPKVPRFR